MKVRAGLLLLLWTVLLLAAGTPAWADSGPGGADLTVAQTLGDRDLTVVVRRVDATPGPVRVEVITHAGTAPGTLVAGLRDRPSQGEIHLGRTPGVYGVTLRVDRPGPVVLTLSDGVRTALVPFEAPRPVVSAAERAMHGGFLTAGALLLAGLVTAVRVRRRFWATLPAAGVVAALAVGVTGAVLSAGAQPVTPAPGAAVNLILGGAQPVAGHPADVTVTLADATTGQPVDAVIHLLVTGPGGRLWHVHPIRTAAGAFAAYLRPPVPGHYAVAAEVEGPGGDLQMARSATGLVVAPPGGTATPTPTTATAARPGSGGGPAELGPMRISTTRAATTTVAGVRVSAAAAGAITASATTVTAVVGDTASLQPWLGMPGHLIIVGPLGPDDDARTAPVWAHTHAMAGTAHLPGMTGAMPPAGSSYPGGGSVPDETVAAYGPVLSFTHTFALPGRYRLWIQVMRDFRVLTVPAFLVVAAGG